MANERKIRVYVETNHIEADNKFSLLQAALSEENCRVLEPKGPGRDQVKGYHVNAMVGPGETDEAVKERVQAAWDDHLTLHGLHKKRPPKKTKWKGRS